MENSVIIFQEDEGKALNRQKNIGDGCPFNCSPYIGCLVGCKYCYTQGAPFKFHTEFGKEVKVKLWFPEKLNRELGAYKTLPQHLKRIQINEACEYYVPEIMEKTEREKGTDLMAEILRVVKNQWEEGNKWMLHILTKSHHVLRHMRELAGMREMVQVEVTLICLDEERRKTVEPYDFPVIDRLRAIRELSDAGIFVRVMAMPLFGEREDAERLRDVAFENDAKAFKHKALNYFTWDDVEQGSPRRTRQRNDTIYRDLLINSGEVVTENGNSIKTELLMPNAEWHKKNWEENLEWQELDKVQFGYSLVNDISWGYIM
jgi:DNA repair photolyase